MQALEFWKTITMDKANFLEGLLGVLAENHIDYCAFGDQAINAYVEPLVSLDLDLVVAADQLQKIETLLGAQYKVERFEHSLNVSAEKSDLRVQFQTDPRYAAFLSRATIKPVLGLNLTVASLEDVLQGKVWAVQSKLRRASKRQKDLADITRLIEDFPHLRASVPPEILAKLEL